MADSKVRSVQRVLVAQQTADGAGVEIKRLFPTSGTGEVDPFLLLDHLGPTDYGPGEMAGFPDHPHRGFETVTYVLEGKFEHRDSQGNHGILSPGDVQWMTAGAGVVHSEMPEENFAKKGGRFQGFQLWVNLPKRDKMIAPRYQDTRSEKIPVVKTPDGLAKIKVIAGEALGTQATIQTRIPIVMLHVELSAGGAFRPRVPRDHSAFAYVLEGELETGGRTILGGRAALFADDGDEIELKSTKGANVLLVAGVALHEPVARYGPFVMNSDAEIHQAIEDFRAGRLGRIPARTS